jgi:uncharacterized protein (TIGR02757 family)
MTSARKLLFTGELKDFLDSKVVQYNRPDFIVSDPVSIPHAFTKREDIEIAALFAATLAWGQRKTIIRNCKDLFHMMDDKPYDFILNHGKKDLLPFQDFKHRTFNSTDLFYFFRFLQWYFKRYDSLEDLFVLADGEDMASGLINFHETFFALKNSSQRTRKHVATPARKSACKRINMFLRWMVRRDDGGVDFGLWKKISPAQLICPIDLHVERVARKLGLIEIQPVSWQTAVELTNKLKQFDPVDPVKYDFALFGLGIEEKF